MGARFLNVYSLSPEHDLATVLINQSLIDCMHRVVEVLPRKDLANPRHVCNAISPI